MGPSHCSLESSPPETERTIATLRFLGTFERNQYYPPFLIGLELKSSSLIGLEIGGEYRSFKMANFI